MSAFFPSDEELAALMPLCPAIPEEVVDEQFARLKAKTATDFPEGTPEEIVGFLLTTLAVMTCTNLALLREKAERNRA